MVMKVPERPTPALVEITVLHKMYSKVILYHFGLHNMIVMTFMDNSDSSLSQFPQPVNYLLMFHLKIICVTVFNNVLSGETNP